MIHKMAEIVAKIKNISFDEAVKEIEEELEPTQIYTLRNQKLTEAKKEQSSYEKMIENLKIEDITF